MVSNNELKYYSSLKLKKFREKESKFLIEGFHLIEECLSSSFHIDAIIFSEALKKDETSEIKNIAINKKIRFESVPEKTFKKLSDTEQTQGIVAVVNKPKSTENIGGNLIIALEKISDPGNLGTIIRTAYWYGIETVLVSEGSADIYNSKVLRSTQGAIFHVNVNETSDFAKQLEKFSRLGYGIYLLNPDGKSAIGKEKISEKAVLVFGNEAEGISKSLQSSDYKTLRIDGFSKCESLNVAVSAGIAMHVVKNP
jgi:TrmH family RNA methyltransferase